MFSSFNFAKLLLAACCLAGLFWSARGTAQEPSGCEYYPLKAGNQWTYRNGDQKVIERVDRVVVLGPKINGKVKEISAYRLVITNKDRVITNKDRELIEFIEVVPDGVYRYAGDDKEVTLPLCLLKLPFPEKDTSWKCSVPVSGSLVTGTFTATKVKEVKVPLRTFEGPILVSGEFQVGVKKMSLKTWFAAGTGIVKKEVTFGNDTTVLELEKFEEAK